MSYYNNCNSNCSTSECDSLQPDFTIKRYDTNPAVRISVEDCSGIMDLTDPNLVVEVNMWTKSFLKKTILSVENKILLANDIGFNQLLIGDLLFFDHPRTPEYMQVISVDENTKEITVLRGLNNTAANTWKKGTTFYIYRIISSLGGIELVYDDIINITGNVIKDQLIQSNLIYNWNQNDTMLSGCYWMEFKLMKVIPQNSKLFFNFDSILQYNIGSDSIFITKDLELSSYEFDYKNSILEIESNLSLYDYIFISESDDIKIVESPDDEGNILIIPNINLDESISIIPILDQGDNSVSVSVYDTNGISLINATQPGTEIKTLGYIKYRDEIVGNYHAGSVDNNFKIEFNDKADSLIIKSVINQISYINISSAPKTKTRVCNIKLKEFNSELQDNVKIYIGINTIPSVQNLEGVEWVRRFPNCGDGFVVKVVNSVTKEM